MTRFDSRLPRILDGYGNFLERCLYDNGLLVRRQRMRYTYDRYGNWLRLVATRWNYNGDFHADQERPDYEGTRIFTYY